jgi:LysR family hydrogen peroxide-inducible transcriptional activator
MENLTRTHPEVDIYVREALTSKLIQELAEGRLDTTIVALPISEPSFTEVALFAENFLLVRPREDTGKPVPNAARNETASVGRGDVLREQHNAGSSLRNSRT